MATQNGAAPATPISPEKEKALSAALTQIDRKYGKGSIMKMGEASSRLIIEVIPTGAIALDIALGAGGVGWVESMLGVDKGGHPAHLLRLGDDVLR